MKRAQSPGSPERANVPWSFDDEAILRRMWADGSTDDDIAGKLGRSRSAVASRRAVLGIGKKCRTT